jgi:hypothetical protein
MMLARGGSDGVIEGPRANALRIKGLRTLDKRALTVLLVEDSPDYAELVQDWLAIGREEMSFVLNWTDTLAADQGPGARYTRHCPERRR